MLLLAGLTFAYYLCKMQINSKSYDAEDVQKIFEKFMLCWLILPTTPFSLEFVLIHLCPIV